MGEIASTYVTIIPKMASGFGAAISGEVGAAGVTGGNKFSAGFGKTASRGFGIVKAGLVGLLASFTIKPIVEGFKDVTGAASDLNETVNKAGVIFGGQFGVMDAWSDNAAKNLGLSKAAALEAAAGFGNMFQQLGFTGQAAADMSRQVVQMATDLGSFNNLDTATVTDMISAAFRGEYDSLQRLIPTINAAAVEQQAMEMTGKKNAKALTLQEKAAATMALVTKGAAVAQGDFAATADGAANKAKIMAAQTEDLKARFGGLMTPLQRLTNDGFEQVIAAGEKFTDWLKDNPSVVEGFTAALSLLGEGFKALGMVLLPVLTVLIEGFSQFLRLIGNGLVELGKLTGQKGLVDAGMKLGIVADGAHAAAKGMESLTLEMWGLRKSAGEAALETAGLTDTLGLVPKLTNAKVAAPGAKPSKGEVDDFIKSLGSIPPEKEAEIRVLADTYGVDVVKKAMASVVDKVVNLQVRTTYTGGSYILPGGAADGGLIGLAGGGTVPGWSAHDRADNILARLTAGEFVQPVSAVEHYGAAAMEAIRQRRAVVAYADGGRVQSPGSVKGAGGFSPSDLADAVAVALDGARLDLGSVDPITHHVSARLLTTIARGV